MKHRILLLSFILLFSFTSKASNKETLNQKTLNGIKIIDSVLSNLTHQDCDFYKRYYSWICEVNMNNPVEDLKQKYLSVDLRNISRQTIIDVIFAYKDFDSFTKGFTNVSEVDHLLDKMGFLKGEKFEIYFVVGIDTKKMQSVICRIKLKNKCLQFKLGERIK